jgi:sugar transferase (PEP-CTERM/EpsH1 system associated)
MKLLMLIHRLPFPADRGAKLRAALELSWLASRHEVWCAGLCETEDANSAAGRQALQEAASSCRGIFAAPLRPRLAHCRAAAWLLTGGTATQGYFSSQRLERQVLGWAREVRFDAVLAFSSSMAPLALRVPAARRVLDMVDLDSNKWAEMSQTGRTMWRHVHRIEARRLARGEREWIAAFDATVLVNGREASRVEPGLRHRVHVVETGHLAGLTPSRTPAPLTTQPVVGFVGAMDYRPNIEAVCWFTECVWPRILACRPDARFIIVGRSPTRAVREQACRPGVEVTGMVAEVGPWFERMRVHVAPLRVARGVQTKVVAAMAAGRPCVVTSCVAEGIGAEPWRDYLVADGPAAIGDAVLSLLSDERRAGELAENGRAYVSRRFDPRPGLERLERLLLGSTAAEQAA